MKPLPFVREVIFLATPQRAATSRPQRARASEYFVRLPSEVVRLSAGVATYTAAGAAELSLAKDSDQHRQHVAGQPLHPGAGAPKSRPQVISHSIIAVDGDEPLDRAGDGVVKYESAHIDGVESELVVHSALGMQAARPRSRKCAASCFCI